MKNPVVRILVAVLAGLLLAGASRPADGSVLKRKRSSSKRRKPPRKKRVRQRMPSDRVAPSGEIEAVVAGEVRRGTFILAHLAPDNLFESSYVVSAIFYHDGFLESFASDREDADPGRRIVARLVLVLTPEHKALYVHLLHGLWDEWGFVDRAPGLALPVAESEPGRRRRRSTHKHALDLFVAEGTRVRTATDGIAVLAEGGWTAGDPFSTSSRRGGNSVVVFDPWQDRFYRYCHLESVVVESGAMLEAGEAIGTVGHTGLNASRPGHGRHLHFEVNEYDGLNMRSFDSRQLRGLLTRGTGPAEPR